MQIQSSLSESQSPVIDFPVSSLSDLVSTRMMELENLAINNPYSLSIEKAASFLHTTPECLRASIEQGRCPFGYAWAVGDRISYKIPTITFISYVTNGSLIRSYQSSVFTA